MLFIKLFKICIFQNTIYFKQFIIKLCLFNMEKQTNIITIFNKGLPLRKTTLLILDKGNTKL